MRHNNDSNSYMDRSPIAEVANRVATAGGGLEAGLYGVALQDHKRLLEAAARRVNDSHRAQMKALGMEPSESGEDDMGGDVTVTGDIHVVQPPPQAKKNPVWPYVAAAALAAGGLGTAGGMYFAQRAVQPAIQQAQDLPEYNLKISTPKELP